MAGSYRMNFSMVWRNRAISPSPGLITDVPVPMTLSPAKRARASRRNTARLPYVCPGAWTNSMLRLPRLSVSPSSTTLPTLAPAMLASMASFSAAVETIGAPVTFCMAGALPQ